MTVAAAAAKAGPYTGNNVVSSFAFSFKVFADADVRVVETLIATEAESDLVLNSDYTVTRNADQDANPGGSITYKVGGVTTALPSTKTLTIVGDFDYEQPTDIPNGGAFFASIMETALDRITMLVKQVKEEVERAVRVPVSSDTDPDALIASLEASEAAAAASAVAAASSAAAAEAAIPSGSLGYTPVDVAGDTMTGPLLLPSINLGGSGAYTSFGNVVTKTVGAASGNVPLVGTKSATTTLAGLVEQSTSAENLAGTDDTVFPSVAGVTEMITEHAPALPAATASVNGYMTSTYAAKLDGIAAGANVGVSTNVGVSGVGMQAELIYVGGAGVISPGTEVPGSFLKWLDPASASLTVASTVAPSGTWKLISGALFLSSSGEHGTFQRTS